MTEHTRTHRVRTNLILLLSYIEEKSRQVEVNWFAQGHHLPDVILSVREAVRSG